MKPLRIAAIHPVLEDSAPVELPLYRPNVSAGFPSPAENYFEERVDLTKELIRNPTSTFLVRVEGDSIGNHF
jgi:DNA polymerase V